MADDELRITANLTDDMSAALARIEARIKSVEDEVEKLGAKGKASGKAAGAGFEELGDKTAEAGRKAAKAKRPIDEAGDAAAKSGAKAAASGAGFDKLGKDMDRAAKKGGGLGTILKVLKLSGLVTGAFALAGGLSAVGAGGAIAVGGLAPMIGVIAGGLPIFAAAKLSMLAWKLAATQLEMPLTRIKNQFTELGPTIARGGLVSGVNYFANSIGRLVKVTGKGLAGLGGELGGAAREAGSIAKSTPFLDQVSTIFAGLRPILRSLLSGLIAIAMVILNVAQAALPMATEMASVFNDAAQAVRLWSIEQLNNGKMTAWLNKAWTIFTRTIGVVVDVVIGLFNTFRIGGGYASEMGMSIEAAAYKFRLWTGSAEGQARINKYFQNSLPALREMGLLLGWVGKAFMSLGGSQDIAPLLAQIRTEFLPVLAQLVTQLSGQGGLGPALISAATAVLSLFAGLDFSALTMFVQGVAAVAQAILWATQNVPGASFAFSLLLGTLLGFKLLSPVWAVVAAGARAYAWVGVATAGVSELSLAQKLLGPGFRVISDGFKVISMGITNWVIPAIRTFAMAGISALRALSVALLTTPIGWLVLAVMAVVAVIVLLWMKCAWFRDAVKAVWEAIKIAAIAVWDAIKVAISATIDFFVAVWQGVVSVFNTVIRAIVDFFTAAWQGAVSVFNTVIDAIVTAAQWIWTKAIKPVMDVIVAAFMIYWNVMKFIVQTVVYIIVGIITLIALAFKGVWDLIVMVAMAVWNSTLKPLFQLIAAVAVAAWTVIQAAAEVVWNAIKAAMQVVGAVFAATWDGIKVVALAVWTAISAAAMWFWNSVLKPVIDGIVWYWTTAWNVITTVASAVWAAIQTGAMAVWSFLAPIFSTIGSVGSGVWTGIQTVASAVWGVIKDGWSAVWGFLSGIWDKLSGAGRAVWDGIKTAAEAVAGAVKGVWSGIVDAVKGAWNWIAKGWNAIPAITVPDWIPLIGGKTFSLPKLPTLWHGGEAPGGKAIVGEHGPEPLVQNGRVTGMVGKNGPEIASIPVGGYVVPNLSTLSALPGLAKSLPAGVARAVASSVPGYAPAVARTGGGNSALSSEIRNLAASLRNQPPPIYADSRDTRAEVESALRTIRREETVRSGYSYSGG